MNKYKLDAKAHRQNWGLYIEAPNATFSKIFFAWLPPKKERVARKILKS